MKKKYNNFLCIFFYIRVLKRLQLYFIFTTHGKRGRTPVRMYWTGCLWGKIVYPCRNHITLINIKHEESSVFRCPLTVKNTRWVPRGAELITRINKQNGRTGRDFAILLWGPITWKRNHHRKIFQIRVFSISFAVVLTAWKKNDLKRNKI